MKEWNYSSTMLDKWYYCLLENTTGVVRDIISNDPKQSKEVISRYFNGIRSHVFTSLMHKINNTMSPDDYDFSVSNLYRIIKEIEWEHTDPNFKYLGIEPDDVLQNLAQYEEKWLSANFKFNNSEKDEKKIAERQIADTVEKA